MVRCDVVIVLCIIFMLTINCVITYDAKTDNILKERNKLYEKNGKNAPSKMFKSVVNVVIMIYRGTFSIALEIQESLISGLNYIKIGFGKITGSTDEQMVDDETTSNSASVVTPEKKGYAQKYINKIYNAVKSYIGKDSPLTKVAMLHGIFITTFYLMLICFIIFRSIFFKSSSYQMSRRRRDINSRNLKENFIPANLVDHKKTYHFETKDSTISN